MQARARLGRPQHRVLGAGGTPSHGLQPCSAHGRNVNSGGELQGGREWSQLCTAATLTRFGAGSGPGTVAGALGPVGAPLSELTLDREHYIPSFSTAEMSTLEGLVERILRSQRPPAATGTELAAGSSPSTLWARVRGWWRGGATPPSAKRMYPPPRRQEHPRPPVTNCRRAASRPGSAGGL